MKIFVTGGAGFIGKHLIKSLNQNHEITVFDNFSNSSKEELDKLDLKKIRIVKGDIRKLEDIKNEIPGHKIVIHLAAKISVSESILNPNETFDVNVKGTENILNTAIINNVKKFFAFSSAAVYGNKINSVYPYTESDKTNPISPYGESKIRMEEKIFSIGNKKIDSKIFRLFNVYGKGQTKEYAGVISKFAKNIRKDQSLTIYGTGNQTRDFIAVEDVVNLLGRMVSFESNNKYGIYNVGTEVSTSISKLGDLMIKLSGKNIPKNFQKEREGDIMHSLASIKKIKEELKFEPKVTLEEGLKNFLNSRNDL